MVFLVHTIITLPWYTLVTNKQATERTRFGMEHHVGPREAHTHIYRAFSTLR